MKIAIDIRTAGGEKTGKGFYTLNLVYNLLKLDQDNQYLLYTDLKIPGFSEFKNVEQRVVKGRGMFWHINVARDCKKQAVDLYWAPTSYIVPALISKSIKTIITIHDLVAFLFPNRHNKKAVILEKIFIQRALKKCTRVLAVSENTKKDVIERFKYDPSKIEVIHCAASKDFQVLAQEDLHQFAKDTNLPTKFFLAVGTIEPRKNYASLIRAFAQLVEKDPDIHLVIVGGKGWQYQDVEAQIRKNYLGKKVHMLGYLSGNSLVKLYNLAQALVFPSLYEGFGIPPLEAMQCGCPVICSNKASLPEVVGEAAILVDPKDHNQIAQAMLEIGDRTDLRDAGLKQAQKFSWKKSAEKLLKIVT